MADRSLKGTGLGAKSFEDEAGVEFAARQEVGYDCPREHHFSLVFAAEAEIPSLWECPRCGAESLRSDGERPEAEGREAGAYALGHAARAPLDRRAGGPAGRAARPCCAPASWARPPSPATPGRKKTA